MKETREVKKTIRGRTAYDGAGVKLVRVFGYGDVKDFDPFLMMDAFDSDQSEDYVKGFPWHPHRGIETITYLIDGAIEHGDSLGHSGIIHSGECQWMTAGSGIIHQEMPLEAPRLRGMQLWLNLPRGSKMTPPKYQGIRVEDVPILSEEGREIRILGGSYKGIPGAMKGDFVEPDYLDITLEAGVSFELEVQRGHTLFVYVLEGAGCFGNDELSHPLHDCVLFGDGEVFKAQTEGVGMRFLLFSGKPLGEPIAWGGPIVMNTKEELDLAFRELESDQFIK